MGLVTRPYEFFIDNNGNPLNSGKIYIGEKNSNPITSPISVYSDSGYLNSVSQPIRTTNGYPVITGTPIELFVQEEYSILVHDENDNLIYSNFSPQSPTFSSDLPWYNATDYGDGSKNTATLDSMKSELGTADKYVVLLKKGDWNLSSYEFTSNMHVYVENGANIISSGSDEITFNGPNWFPDSKIFSLSGNAKVIFGTGYISEIKTVWYGMIPGTTSEISIANTNAFQSAIDSSTDQYVGGSYGGGTIPVKIMPGTFRIGEIIYKKAVDIIGSGEGVTIFLFDVDGGTMFKNPSKTSQSANDNVANCNYESFTLGIDSSLTPTTPTVLFDTTGATYCNFKNISISGIQSNIIGIDNTGNSLAGSGGPSHWYNSWTNIHFYVTGGIALRWGDSDTSYEQVTAQNFYGGSFKGTSGTGMHIRGGTGISFFGTVFEGLNSGSNVTVTLGNSSGSRITTSVNFHGCYFEQAKITMYSNTNRCQRWGGFETSMTITDNGDRNGRVDYEQTYRGWPRTYASGRVTTAGLTVNKSYNVDTGTGVSKPGTGLFSIPFNTALSDTNYVAIGISESSDLYCRVSTKQTTSINFAFLDDTGALTDPTSFSFVVIDNDA